MMWINKSRLCGFCLGYHLEINGSINELSEQGSERVISCYETVFSEVAGVDIVFWWAGSGVVFCAVVCVEVGDEGCVDYWGKEGAVRD